MNVVQVVFPTPPGFIRLPSSGDFGKTVKGNFSADIFLYGIFSADDFAGKSRKRAKIIMLTKTDIRNAFPQAKGGVEKPVEIVEKYLISTMKPGISTLLTAVWGRIGKCITGKAVAKNIIMSPGKSVDLLEKKAKKVG